MQNTLSRASVPPCPPHTPSVFTHSSPAPTKAAMTAAVLAAHRLVLLPSREKRRLEKLGPSGLFSPSFFLVCFAPGQPPSGSNIKLLAEFLHSIHACTKIGNCSLVA